jgi:UDP-N-acetylmuramyl pentapeptide synthase
MDFNSLLELTSTADAPRLRIDSRLVQPGDCFIAISGTQYDGHDFLSKALSAGARYIVAEKSADCEPAKIIIVDDTTVAAAILAQAANANPASKLTNLAVTGTNGKTTVAFLVRLVLGSAGRICHQCRHYRRHDAGQTYPEVAVQSQRSYQRAGRL